MTCSAVNCVIFKCSLIIFECASSDFKVNKNVCRNTHIAIDVAYRHIFATAVLVSGSGEVASNKKEITSETVTERKMANLIALFISFFSSASRFIGKLLYASQQPIGTNIIAIKFAIVAIACSIEIVLIDCGCPLGR
jgi:hypothetical protein